MDEAKEIRRALYIVLVLFVLGVLLLVPERAIGACRSALSLCGRLIIPSLFPFFVLSGLLNRLGLPEILGRMLAAPAARLYRISGAGASALLIGLTGGYPTGAAYIADMEQSGTVSTAEGERLLAFCNNSGPAFIIGAVGTGAFASVRAGLFLYAVHIASALITGLFFRGKSCPEESEPSLFLLDTVSPAQALSSAVRQSVSSLLNICGFVICFSVLISLLDGYGSFSMLCGVLSRLFGWELHFSRSLLTGVLELGNSVGAMEGLSCTPANLALAAGILGWGSLSVHLQTISVISDSHIKGTLHFAGRLISAAVSAVTAYLTALILF